MQQEVCNWIPPWSDGQGGSQLEYLLLSVYLFSPLSDVKPHTLRKVCLLKSMLQKSKSMH